MIIDINQYKLSGGSKFNILIDKNRCYTAKALRVKWKRCLIIEDLEKKIVLTIKAERYFFKPKYCIEIDGAKFQFRCLSMWSGKYVCQYKDFNFEIFGHNGRKYSVFKNNNQVAFWDKDLVAIFEGDNYRIVVNNDENPLILIAFCLIFDEILSRDNGNSTVTFDLGSCFYKGKKFDVNWRPKV